MNFSSILLNITYHIFKAYKRFNWFLRGVRKILRYFLLSFGKYNKPLKFHQNVNHDTVYKCEKLLVHGIIRSFLVKWQICILPVTRGNPNTSQSHFNASYCSNVFKHLTYERKWELYFISYLLFLFQDVNINIFYLFFFVEKSGYFYLKVKLLWHVSCSHFVHIIELLTSVCV